MKNPWLDLPKTTPFLLKSDMDLIDAFNERARDSRRIHTELLPEPFLGNPTAPVMLLGLNPGFSTDDEIHHSIPEFARMSRANLEHQGSDYPFHLLNPRISGPGREWWERRLTPILNCAPRQVVAQRICCVEYFPYHTQRFSHKRLHLKSQEYSFHLVRNAMRRNAIVVLMRSRRLWFEAIPELKKHPKLFVLNSPQNTIISRNNCPDGFDVICRTIKAAESRRNR